MSDHQTVTGTLTASGATSAVFYLRPDEVVAVTATFTGTGKVSLSQVLGQPAQAYRPLIAWTTSQSATEWRNTTNQDLYLVLRADRLDAGASVAYTLADVEGDQILAEWYTADGTLAARITDEGISGFADNVSVGGVLNVKDPRFGAVGDGVTDDTAAFNAAIDVAAGKTVIAPTPDVAWYFAGTVAMDQVGVTLRFEAGDITFASGARILVTADGCSVLGTGDDTHFDASANATTNATIRTEANWTRFADFKVTGSRGVGGGAASTVSAGGTSKTNLTVERIHSVNAGSHGISSSRDTSTVRDCVIESPELSGIFYASGSVNALAARNTITQPNRASTAGQGGIAVQGNTSVDGMDERFLFVDNDIDGAIGNGIIINNGTSTGQTRTRFVTIRGGFHGPMEDDNGGTGTEGEAISGSCDYLTVEGVGFRGAWNEAVNFTAAGTQSFRGFVCRGCTSVDGTLEPSGVVQSNGCGIEVNALDTASVDGFVIEGNTIIDTRGVSAATLGGVSVRQGDAGASLINGVVRNNTAIGTVNDTVLMVESAGANLEALNDLMQAGLPDRARQPVAIQFVLANTSAWTNQPLALTEIFGSTIRRTRFDVSRYRQARLVARVATIGTAGAVLRGQYSTDDSTYAYMDGSTGPEVSLAATGTIAGSWVTLTSASIADVYLRIVGVGGDGATSPVINTLILELR